MSVNTIPTSVPSIHSTVDDYINKLKTYEYNIDIKDQEFASVFNYVQSITEEFIYYLTLANDKSNEQIQNVDDMSQRINDLERVVEMIRVFNSVLQRVGYPRIFTTTDGNRRFNFNKIRIPSDIYTMRDRPAVRALISTHHMRLPRLLAGTVRSHRIEEYTKPLKSK